jgi:hypothetical protein
MWHCAFPSHPPFKGPRNEKPTKQKPFYLWVLTTAVNFIALSSLAHCLVSPKNLKVPAWTTVLAEGLPCMSSPKADVALCLPLANFLSYYTHLRVLIKSNVERHCSNPPALRGAFTLFEILLGSKLGRCLFLLQFTAASLYWAVKGSTTISNHVALVWSPWPFRGCL